MALIRDPMSSTGLAGPGSTDIYHLLKTEREDGAPPFTPAKPRTGPMTPQQLAAQAGQKPEPGKPLRVPFLHPMKVAVNLMDDSPRKIRVGALRQDGLDVRVDDIGCHNGLKPGTTLRDLLGDQAIDRDNQHTPTNSLKVASAKFYDDEFFKTASAQRVSPFAAAFYLGCTFAQLPYERFQHAVKEASAVDDDIAAELAVFADESQPLMRKYAANPWMDMATGGFNAARRWLTSGGARAAGQAAAGMGDDAASAAAGAAKGPWAAGAAANAPFDMGAAARGAGFAADNAARAQAAQAAGHAVGPSAGGSMWNRFWRGAQTGGPINRAGGNAATGMGPGNMYDAGKSVFRNAVMEPAMGAATGYSLGGLGDLAAYGATGEDPGLRNYGAMAGGVARMPFLRRALLQGTQSKNPLVRGVSRPLASASQWATDPGGFNPMAKGMSMQRRLNAAAQLGGVGAGTYENFVRPGLQREADNMATESTNKVLSRMTGGGINSIEEWEQNPMYRVMQAFNQDGIGGAVQAGWNELTPQQQQYLLGAGLLGAGGIGAAAMGYPMVGAGLGLGALGVGGYGLSQGFGNVGAQMMGQLSPDMQSSVSQYFQQNPDALDALTHSPRSQQATMMSQLLAQLQNQGVGQELQRATGGPAPAAPQASPAEELPAIE